MRLVHDKWLLLAAIGLLLGCPTAPTDDDDSSVVADDDDATGDDDDTTPPPDPIAPVIGLFNLINVVQAEGVSYVDFSGAFGTFVETPDDVLSPAAYLGTFSYGADAPYWRIDLGAYPLPALGESAVVDMPAYLTWVPDQQTWWDGGPRIGAGNYLCSRLDFTDVTAYQVDDPVSPGAAGWTAGGTLSWEMSDGADVVAWSAPDGINLPEPMVLVEPAEGSASAIPSTEELEVRWAPGADGSYVTVGLIDASGLAYIAHVPDNGEHLVPASVLHDEFGSGSVELVVARNLDSVLEHPQGDILARAREERRARLELLPDLAIEPGYGEPGQSLTVAITWFVADMSAGLDADFGEGVTVVGTTPDPSDAHRAIAQLQVAPDAAPGGRDVTLSTPGGDNTTLVGGFSVLNLLPSDDCASADAAPPLGPGSWSSTTAGLVNDYGSGFACLSWSLNGADAVYRVDLAAGETLIATLDEADPGDGALILLSDCAQPASAVACADNGAAGASETLAWTATSDGTWYLVIDAYLGYADVFSSAWELEIGIEQDVLDPDWIVPGTNRAFTLFGEAPWDAGILPADIDLGAGVGVEAAGPGSLPTELDFLAIAALGATLGAHDVAVDNGPGGLVEYPGALWVTGWPSWNTCDEATAAAVELPGSTTGYAVKTTSTIDDVSCMPYPSSGPEVIIPVELAAGAVMTVDVTLPDEDAQLYILADCYDTDSCFDDAVADDTFDGDLESIAGWVAPSAGTYFVVVDVYGGVSAPLVPWQFDLSITVD